MNRRQAYKDRQRIREIRDKRHHYSAGESVSRKKSVIITNIVIEVITGIILLVGVYYLVQFILISRYFAGESITRISIGAITVFAGGYIIYLAIKIRSGIEKLRSTDNNSDTDISE